MVDLERVAFQKALKKNVKVVLERMRRVRLERIKSIQGFEYYVQYGMTPMQAIRSATSMASELLGWKDKVGTIESDKMGGYGCREPRSLEGHFGLSRK